MGWLWQVNHDPSLNSRDVLNFCIGGLSFVSSREGFICDSVSSCKHDLHRLHTYLGTHATIPSRVKIHSRKYPQILNFEVVLASGAIVNANAHENSDLWIALRGGGNNLGIVTRFDFRTFKKGPLYGGSLYYFGDSFPGQLDALVDELQKPDASEETHLMVSIGYAATFGPQMMCMNRKL